MIKQLKIALVFFELMFGSFRIGAQTLDQLKNDLQNAKDDTSRCAILTKLIEAEYDDNIWPIYNEQLQKIAESHLKNVDSPKSKLDSVYFEQLSEAYNNSGYIHQNKGNYKKALEFYNRSLELERKTNDKRNISMTYNNIAGIYIEQNEYKNAIDFFTKSLEMRVAINDKEGIGQSLANLGSTFGHLGDTAKAHQYYTESLKISLEVNNLSRIAFIYNNLGKLFQASGKYEEAIGYLKKSLAIQQKINNKKGMCVVLGNLSDIYEMQGKLDESKKVALLALDIANELGFPIHIKSQALTLYNIEKRQGHWQKALEYYRLFINMRDSVLNIDNAKATITEQVQFEFEKQKAVEQAVHEKELLVSNEREQKQKIISIAIGGGLFLVFVFAVFIYNRLRITKKQKKIIEEQKGLVEEKNRIIEEKQKDILDSIHYAKRIQQSLLPSEKYIDRNISRSKKS